MNKKILIGSIFAAFLMLSAPVFSNVQAQRTSSALTSNSVHKDISNVDPSTLSLEEVVALTQDIVDTILFYVNEIQNEYGDNPAIAEKCQEAKLLLTSADKPICYLLNVMILVLNILIGICTIVGCPTELTEIFIIALIYCGTLYLLICMRPVSNPSALESDMPVSSECSLCGSFQ